MGENPAVGIEQLAAAPARDGAARLARRARLPGDRERVVLVRRARDRDQRIEHGRNRDGGLPHARGRAHREERDLHEHPAPPAMAPRGRAAARRRALGAVVHVPPGYPDQGAARRFDQTSATARCWTSRGTTRPAGRTPSPTPRPCSARSTATSYRSQAAKPPAFSCPGTRSCAPTARPRAAAGSTAAASPTASTRRPAVARARTELGRSRVGLGVAAQPAHALQPRVGRSGRPPVVGAQALRVVGRGAGALDRRGRAGLQGRTCRRRTCRPRARAPRRRLRGNVPFVVQADGRGWLFAPTGVVDGPLPAHYEPHESPVANPLYGQSANPVTLLYEHAESPFNPSAGEPGADVFPYVFTTYRLTEHHTAGAMSRTLPYLAELQPEMFCEVGPELAAERGLEHGGWATIVTTRTAIEARVLVTERIPSLRLGGRTVHQVGLPYHWGTRGISTGDSANDLIHLAADPNVHIQESKAATCDVRAGRRPRGPALVALVEEYRRRAAAGGAGDVRMRGHAVLRRRGARARRLLHRHDALHRLQGVRGRLQAMERRARRPARVHRRVLRQLGVAGSQPLAPRAVRGAVRRPETADMRWLMNSDVCKHCTEAACLDACPTGRAVPHRVRHRGRAARRVQRLRVLRGRLPVRRARPAQGRRPGVEVHALLRPAEGRRGAGVREGVPHRLDPVRAAGRAARARGRAAGARARRGRGRARTYMEPIPATGSAARAPSSC